MTVFGPVDTPGVLAVCGVGEMISDERDDRSPSRSTSTDGMVGTKAGTSGGGVMMGLVLMVLVLYDEPFQPYPRIRCGWCKCDDEVLLFGDTPDGSSHLLVLQLTE